MTLTTSGLRPATSFDDTPEALDPDAVGAVGRAAQQLVEALDQGLEIARGTSAYLWLGPRVVSGWAIQLLLVALLLPVLAATVDLFARCRRLHVQLGPALRALRSRAWLWLWVGVLFELFRLAGAWPGGEPRPVDPASPAVANWDVLPLALFGGIAVASWLVGKGRLQPRRAPTEEERLAGYAAACLGLGLIGILSLAINPYSILFLLPSLHCWLWLAQVRNRRALRRLLLLLGMAGPAVLLASFAVRFQLGWDAPWYLIVLAGVGKLPVVGIALALAWCAVLAQLAALEAGRYAPYPRPNERGLDD